MKTSRVIAAGGLGALLVGAVPAVAQLPGQAQAVKNSLAQVPAPPWPRGDERGMANAIGPGTWQRCAFHLMQPGARSYELSHIRSNTMPLSPFGAPLKYEFRATVGIPGTRHAFNGEKVSGEPAGQGTQMDALGHFAYLPKPWDGKPPFPAEAATYYGGFTQDQVKPSADSELKKLGIENAPPIVTSAVLLDAKTHLGGGKPMEPGQQISAADIEAMIEKQGLGWRGILPGDVLYIYTGWSDHWADPDRKKIYYTKGPGLSYDAARYIEEKRVVLVALDNPFTDPAAEGKIRGEAPPTPGTPEGLPWAIHHYNLTQAGIHQIQNARLRPMAEDRTWTACTMILPLRVRGGSGSAVRPIAIGVPDQ